MLKVKVNKENINQILDMINIEDRLSELEQEYKLGLIENSVDDAVMDVIFRKKENKRTFSDLKKIILRKQLDEQYESALKEYEEEYIEFIPKHNHDVEYEEFDAPYTYNERGEDGKIYQRWGVEKNNKSLINDKIKQLKEELASTDYVVIKAYEAKLSMSDSPYSQDKLDEITQHRQTLRDRINELKELIK